MFPAVVAGTAAANRGMRSCLRPTSGVALVLIALLPRVSAAEEQVPSCRKAIGKAGTSLVRAIMTAEQGCLERRLAGKIPSTAGCTDEGPSLVGVDEPATRDKIQKAIAKARAAVTKKCTGLSPTAPANAGLGMAATCPSADAVCAAIAVTDLASVLDCLECAQVSTAQALVAIPYDSTAAMMLSNGVGGPR